MKGYKMTKPDHTDYYSGTVRYEVGKVVECPGDKDGKPCTEQKNDGSTTGGIHICKVPWFPMKYNTKYPWWLIEVEYDEKDILGQDYEKIRVSRLKVVRELRPFLDSEIPNADKLEALVHRIEAIKWKCQTVARKKKISALVRRYAKELSTKDKKIKVKVIKYYTVAEWNSLRDSLGASLRASLRASLGASLRDSLGDSLWASLWASLRDSLGASLRASLWASLGASLRDSLRDSLWDSLWASLRDSLWATVDGHDKYRVFITEMKIVMESAFLMGITDDGTAHVVMPGKDEIVKR